MLLLFFSTVEAAMCLFWSWKTTTAHCKCKRADLSSPLLSTLNY